ncbi:hypothetical protein BCK_19130 [Bacillus cereus FRI-35]|nr:hypothetical protein BCK_19130 [Bacillus cereus FRI-35]
MILCYGDNNIMMDIYQEIKEKMKKI